MHREIHSWWSHRLHREMPVAVYGHYGFALLMLPTAAADYLEYERFQLIESIRWFIDSGKVKVFSINSVNDETWFRDWASPHDKSARHETYNHYVYEEVVPFIRTHCQGPVPIVTTGSSVGALHALNLFLRRADLFAGTIAMSGVYDLTYYSRGYFDDNVYFNSPAHYLPGWNDGAMLDHMRHSNIVIASGQGAYEAPHYSRHISDILHGKGVPHLLDLWGHDMTHDWPTWRNMLPHFLGTRFGG